MHNFFYSEQDIPASGSTGGSGEATDFEFRVWNLPRLMSSANRKQFHNVDIQGNAQVYTLRVDFSATKGKLAVYTAPDIYSTKRAVKTWHEARKLMYKRAGFALKELNAYGRTLRPYLHSDHFKGENSMTVSIPQYKGEFDTESASGDGLFPHAQQIDWDYSRAVVTTPQEEGHTTDQQERDLVDSYFFNVLDESIVESSSSDSSTGSEENSFEAVGMVSEWLDSFRKRGSNLITDEFIDSDNALLQLMNDSLSSEEVLELVEDQDKQQMPWDRDGSTYRTRYPAAFLCSSSDNTQSAIIRAPLGLVEFMQENDSGSSDRQYTRVQVLAIEDM